MDRVSAPSPTYNLDANPQLMWANVLVVCASLLLALVLLTLAVGWWRHFSRWLILCGLLSLATSIAVALAAHHFYDTYASWSAFFASLLHGRSAYMVPIYEEIGTDDQQATVLGWVGVGVTGMLLAVDFLGIWRLRGKARM
jgi:hypothetical protein